MRVYVPTTLPELARVLAAGEVGPPPLRGWAVTAPVRAAHASAELEDLEDDALYLAGSASLDLLAADPAAPARRVVLSLDAEPADVRAVGDDGEVALTASVRLSRMASAHLDDGDAVPAVEAARQARGRTGDGEGHLEDVDALVEEHALLWYGVQELPAVLEDPSV